MNTQDFLYALGETDDEFILEAFLWKDDGTCKPDENGC